MVQEIGNGQQAGIVKKGGRVNWRKVNAATINGNMKKKRKNRKIFSTPDRFSLLFLIRTQTKK